MTARELLSILEDMLHDWTDGDDPVESYDSYGNKILVTFESGNMFTITVDSTADATDD